MATGQELNRETVSGSRVRQARRRAAQGSGSGDLGELLILSPVSSAAWTRANRTQLDEVEGIEEAEIVDDAEEAAGPGRTPRRHPAEQVSVSLVLSAGGAAAEAWHAGVVRALHAVDGLGRPPIAELILPAPRPAPSPGLCLRAGIPARGPLRTPARRARQRRGAGHHRPGGHPLQRGPHRARLDRAATPVADSDWRELCGRPWQARPLHAAVGLLPRGARTTEALQQRMAELHPEPWPAARFWVHGCPALRRRASGVRTRRPPGHRGGGGAGQLRRAGAVRAGRGERKS